MVYIVSSWVELGASWGTGDFLADGTVPMTGNLRLNDNWLSNDGDSEGIRVTNTGDVGIGTAAPSQKLQVNGNIKAIQVETDQTPVIRVYLDPSNCSGGPCPSHHTLNAWYNIGANYTHAVTYNNDPSTFTASNGVVTVHKAGTYRIRIHMMQIPSVATSYRYAAPYINGAVNTMGASSADYVPHTYMPTSIWTSTVHTFTGNITAGSTVSYGYHPHVALDYWAHVNYTGMEIVREN